MYKLTSGEQTAPHTTKTASTKTSLNSLANVAVSIFYLQFVDTAKDLFF